MTFMTIFFICLGTAFIVLAILIKREMRGLSKTIDDLDSFTKELKSARKKWSNHK